MESLEWQDRFLRYEDWSSDAYLLKIRFPDFGTIKKDVKYMGNSEVGAL